jgi:hypothetical protein
MSSAGASVQLPILLSLVSVGGVLLLLSRFLGRLDLVLATGAYWLDPDTSELPGRVGGSRWPARWSSSVA